MVRWVPRLRVFGARAWLATLILLALSLGNVEDVAQYRIDQLVSGQGWSALAWEARHLPAGAGLILAQVRAETTQSALDERLRAYLTAQDVPPADDQVPLDLALAAAVQRQLVESGLPTLGPLVAPPVAIALADPPLSLVVSPRDEIRVSQWALLEGDIVLNDMERLEREVERLNLSALVAPIGGIATYPTLIPRDMAPAVALQTIAHEWTHIYLFFRPLGRAYDTGFSQRTMNETTADIVGLEVATGIMHRLGLAERRSGSHVEETAEGAFDIRAALRRIRLETDALLAAGDVEGAEALMERERLDLVARGYRIRRLNQAYFAFHGNYAEGPQRSTEIPDRLADLRRQSASLGDFLGRVGEVTSLADLRVLTPTVSS